MQNGSISVICCRWKRTDSGEIIKKDGRPLLQFVAIERGDSGEWAIPGVRRFLYIAQFVQDVNKLLTSTIHSQYYCDDKSHGGHMRERGNVLCRERREGRKKSLEFDDDFHTQPHSHNKVAEILDHLNSLRGTLCTTPKSVD